MSEETIGYTILTLSRCELELKCNIGVKSQCRFVILGWKRRYDRGQMSRVRLPPLGMGTTQPATSNMSQMRHWTGNHRGWP